jgi:hypothetical protein
MIAAPVRAQTQSGVLVPNTYSIHALGSVSAKSVKQSPAEVSTTVYDITVNVGDVGQVRLPTNPSTGCEWWVESAPDAVEISVSGGINTAIDCGNPPRPGCSNQVAVYSFSSNTAGYYTIELRYGHSWAHDEYYQVAIVHLTVVYVTTPVTIPVTTSHLSEVKFRGSIITVTSAGKSAEIVARVEEVLEDSTGQLKPDDNAYIDADCSVNNCRLDLPLSPSDRIEVFGQGSYGPKVLPDGTIVQVGLGVSVPPYYVIKISITCAPSSVVLAIFPSSDQSVAARVKLGAEATVGVFLRPQRQVKVSLRLQAPSGQVVDLSGMSRPDGVLSKDLTPNEVGVWQVYAEAEGCRDSALLMVLGDGWKSDQVTELIEMKYHPGDELVAKAVEHIRLKNMDEYANQFRIPTHKLTYYVTYATSDPELPWTIRIDQNCMTNPACFKAIAGDHQMMLAVFLSMDMVRGGFSADRFEALWGRTIAHEFMHYVEDAYWDDFRGLTYSVRYPDVVEGIAEYVARQFYPVSEGAHQEEFKFIDCVVRGTGGNALNVISRILDETGKDEIWEGMNTGFKRATSKTCDEWRKACNCSVQTKSLAAMEETGRKLLLHVFDEQGRHVGYSKDQDQVEVGIPGAEYHDFGNAILIALPLELHTFTCTIDASEAERNSEGYVLSLVNNQEKPVVRTLQGEISRAASRSYRVTVEPDRIEVSEQGATGPSMLPFEIVIGAIVLLVIVLVPLAIRRRRQMAQPRTSLAAAGARFPASKFCVRCGSLMPRANKFCPRCGSRQF